MIRPTRPPRSGCVGWLALHAKEFPIRGRVLGQGRGLAPRALKPGSSGLSWPRVRRTGTRAGLTSSSTRSWPVPARRPPSLGYLVVGLGHHGSKELQQRFLPGMINGTERWCQGLLEPRCGFRTWRRADHHRRPGRRQLVDQRSQDLDQLLRHRRLVPGAGPHESGSQTAQRVSRRSSAHAPAPEGIEQRPLKMISGIAKVRSGQLRQRRRARREHGRRSR